MEENLPQRGRFAYWRSILLFVGEIVKVLVISLAIIIPVRYYLIQPFYVKGASMEPNYLNKDYLIVDEATYKVLKKAPNRGEAVVFHYPLDQKQYFIKRIIGLPGEQIMISDGEVFIYNKKNPEGIKLDENDYLVEKTYTKQLSLNVILKENEYFVLGDNRDQSMDSREFGPIDFDLIVGKVWLRGIPFSRAGKIQMPNYNL